jgi:hypothetical protein
LAERIGHDWLRSTLLIFLKRKLISCESNEDVGTRLASQFWAEAFAYKSINLLISTQKFTRRQACYIYLIFVFRWRHCHQHACCSSGIRSTGKSMFSEAACVSLMTFLPSGACKRMEQFVWSIT